MNKRPSTPTEIKNMKEKIMNASDKERNVIYAELEAKKKSLMAKGIKQGTPCR